MLSDDDFKRYQRQISVSEVGELGQQKLAKTHVLVMGCGGLGNAAALYLAASGVGKLVLVDDDQLEESNLQRQIAYRETDLGKSKVNALTDQLKGINPLVQVRAINKRLGQQQLALEVMLADVVLDCTDNFVSRHLINRVCYEQATDLISGSAIGWKGQFSWFQFSNGNRVDSSGCYQCMIPESPDLLNQDISCSSLGIIGPVVGTIANYQAITAIQVVINHHLKIKPSVVHLFDGLKLDWQQFNISQDPSCPVCRGNSRE